MMNYYFKAVLFIAVFVSFGTHAQVSPFEDYSKCQAGFLKANGDTLYKAQFENVQPISLYDTQSTSGVKKAWTVEFSNRKGCIDVTGKWILECIYDDINYNYEKNLFFVRKDKSGVFNTKGEVILPCFYDRLNLQTVGYFEYFETERSELKCAYSLAGKALTPECNYFEPHYLWSIDSAGKSKTYFVFHKYENGQVSYGLTDETGKDFSFPQYRSTELYFFDGQVTEDEQLFVVTNEKGERAFADKNGKKLTGFFDPKCSLQLIPFIEPGSRIMTYRHALTEVKVKEEWKMNILNLKTGKESIMYDEVCPVGDYFVTRQRKEAFVLDENFNTLFHTSLKSKNLAAFNGAENEIYRVSELYTTSRWQMPVFDIERMNRRSMDAQSIYNLSDDVILLDREEVSKKERKFRLEARHNYQIIQTKTGKLLEKKYDDILRGVSKEGIYLWAINQKEDDSLFVDVYSYDGIFQRSLVIDQMQAEQIRHELEYYYNDSGLKDPVIWISDDSGKYKGIHHNGNSITSFAFDERPEVVFSKNDEKWVFCEGYDSGGIYYNELHQPLFDGKRVNRLIHLNDNKNFYVNTSESGYLLNQDFEITEDSVSWLDFISSENVLKIPETYFPICAKGEFGYVFTDGKLRLLDSTLFLHPQKINQVNKYSFKVDARGKFYTEEKKSSSEKSQDIIANLQLILRSGTLTVTDKTTLKVVNVIEKVASFSYDMEKSVLVQFVDEKQGLLDWKTGKWRIEPKYTEIKSQAFNTSKKEVYWVRIEDQNDGKWFPLDESGKVLAQPIFDECVYAYSYGREQLIPFKSYGKVGLINSDYKIVVQPTFDKVIGHDNFRVFFKDNIPYLVFSPNGDKMEIKHPISDFFVNKSFLFLFNDSIEVISDAGKTLVPPMQVEKAMKDYALVDFFIFPQEKKRPFPDIFNQEVFCATDDLATRYYSNHVIMEEAKNFVRQLGELGTVRKRDLYYDYDGRCRVEPIWISKYLCTERVYGVCFPESGGKYRDFNSGCGYRVYKIAKDTCVQLTIEDLIKDDPASGQKLDDVIRAEIQKKQSFGLVCADMDGAIAKFKLNFSVDERYLYMTNEQLREYVTIPIKDLKGILRNPEWFD